MDERSDAEGDVLQERRANFWFDEKDGEEDEK